MWWLEFHLVGNTGTRTNSPLSQGSTLEAPRQGTSISAGSADASRDPDVPVPLRTRQPAVLASAHLQGGVRELRRGGASSLVWGPSVCVSTRHCPSGAFVSLRLCSFARRGWDRNLRGKGSGERKLDSWRILLFGRVSHSWETLFFNLFLAGKD